MSIVVPPPTAMKASGVPLISFSSACTVSTLGLALGTTRWVMAGILVQRRKDAAMKTSAPQSLYAVPSVTRHTWGLPLQNSIRAFSAFSLPTVNICPAILFSTFYMPYTSTLRFQEPSCKALCSFRTTTNVMMSLKVLRQALWCVFFHTRLLLHDIPKTCLSCSLSHADIPSVVSSLPDAHTDRGGERRTKADQICATETVGDHFDNPLRYDLQADMVHSPSRDMRHHRRLAA